MVGRLFVRGLIEREVFFISLLGVVVKGKVFCGDSWILSFVKF